MVKTEAFRVEQWMNKYETTPGVLNIAETCCASVSVNDLIGLSTDKSAKSPLDTDTKLTYGPIRGSNTLRSRIAALCSGDSTQIDVDDVIVTSGAINANFLTLYSLIGPGDHVVCVYPTYQQLYSVPTCLGAQVDLWKLREKDGFRLNVNDLLDLIRENTKMIIINNPNNPTGVPISTALMQDIVAVAKANDIILFSDEVYRPLFHDGAEGDHVPKPALAFGYEKTIVTGSMSKAFGLAGIRLGWVASRDKALVEAMAVARDYTTISVSQLDDQIASFALSPVVQPSLLKRNIALARTNVSLLAKFVEDHGSVCSWTKPSAGTTAFIKFHDKNHPVLDDQFCLDVLEKTKVFFVPGSHCFGQDTDFLGYVRIGYVCETNVLEEALAKLSNYVKTVLDK